MTDSRAHRVERALGRVLVEEGLDNPGRDKRSDDEPLPRDVRARDRVSWFLDVLPDLVGETLAQILCGDCLFPRGAEIPHEDLRRVRFPGSEVPLSLECKNWAPIP